MTALGPRVPTPDVPSALVEDILGYLNLSNGNHHPAFASHVNALCGFFDSTTSWSAIRDLLGKSLTLLSDTSTAFADNRQASAVLDLTFDGLVPRYRLHHTDLLFHLDEGDWEHPFLLVQMFEAVLQQGSAWDETDRILEAALDTLNDFLGYRPVPVLENDQYCEPYPHERYRPVPVYLAGVGAATGPCHDLVARTIEILDQTPSQLLAIAHFDPSHLDELALDIRAHDHLHPVNKRTTYMFGEWDPDHIDNRGFYRRFILRKIILDALLGWMTTACGEGQPESETLEDAAIVLAGTVLMASAISGAGPDTHDSTVSLTTLLPVVARLRDAFYEYHMQQAEGPRAELLAGLAAKTQQPFGHVRQELNLALARYGARQIQHRQLALLYARMGFPAAARQQAEAIPAASIRFECEIQCAVTSAEISAERGNVSESVTYLATARDLLTRGVDCGALPDPWNYLGYQAQFPLFHAREDSIPDARLEDLLMMMERLFTGYGKALSEAAARGQNELVDRLDNDFQTLALNWDGYGASIVIDLNAESGVRRWWSASQAARVLATWQSAGSARGDVAFWAEQVRDFSSFQAGPAYAQIVDALLDRHDLPATMGLLMQWLDQAIPTDLAGGPESIGSLLHRWLELATDPVHFRPSLQHTRLVERFFAVLEVNAESFWSVPGLDDGLIDVSGPTDARSIEDIIAGLDYETENGFEDAPDDEDDENDEDALYAAAYDDVTFRDSTDDGLDAELLDEGFVAGTTEFEGIYRELEPRLKFLESVARLWQQLIVGASALPGLDPDAVQNWSRQARTMQEGLLNLLDAIWQNEIPIPSLASDAGIEFDIQLQTKYELLRVVMAVHVQARRAELMLQGLLPVAAVEVEDEKGDHYHWRTLTQAVIHGDTTMVRRTLPEVLRRMVRQPLLYVPLDAGGDPHQMLAARTRHTDLQFLAEHLPRLGLLRETAHVLRTAYRMERSARPEGAVVTEFDRLFRVVFRHVLEAVSDAASGWRPNEHRPGGTRRCETPGGPPRRGRHRRNRQRRPDQRQPKSGAWRDRQLLLLVDQLVDRFQLPWLRHSSRTRLSAAEALESAETWTEAKKFIETYGSELFAAPNLTLGHIRAILHHGTDWFLDSLEAEAEADPLAESRLLEDLQNETLDRDTANRLLQLVYHTVIDRYHRFIEYNTTTTQSDYGEKIYCLMDFLRLEAAYDRDAWNFSPSEIAHEVLAQGPRPWLATVWEKIRAPAVRRRADEHLDRLESLEALWGMRLPALADRLGERFLRPLAVNRMQAMIDAARADAREPHHRSEIFELLRAEVDRYLQDTHGSGIDVPSWLQRLEQALDRRPAGKRPRSRNGLTPRAIEHQLATWRRPAWPRRR